MMKSPSTKGRQRHGNAADAQARHQRGDVHAEVVEAEQQQERPQHQPGGEVHHRQRGGGAGVGRQRQRPRAPDPELDQRAQPQAHLHHCRHGRRALEHQVGAIGQRQVLRADVKRHEEHQPLARAPHHLDQRIVERRVRLADQP
jgi:hypothetical protein